MSPACRSLNPNGDFQESLIPSVQALVGTPVRERVLGSSLSTFAIGGEVRAVVTVESVEELSCVVSLLSQEEQEFRVIGNGSNVLFGDGALPNLVSQAWGWPQKESSLMLAESLRSLGRCL